MKRIAQLENQYRRDVAEFNSGDTIRVHYRIKEGDKERIQVFQGTVISRRGSGTGKTFTVRKISSGIGVERVFPLYSPNIDKVERLTMGRVRRAKLYYLRELTGKSARIKTRLGEKADKERARDKNSDKTSKVIETKEEVAPVVETEVPATDDKPATDEKAE